MFSSLNLAPILSMSPATIRCLLPAAPVGGLVGWFLVGYFAGSPVCPLLAVLACCSFRSFARSSVLMAKVDDGRIVSVGEKDKS